MVKWHGAEQGTAVLATLGAGCSLAAASTGHWAAAASLLLASLMAVLQSTTAAYGISAHREHGWFMWWVSVPDRLESAHLLAACLACLTWPTPSGTPWGATGSTTALTTYWLLCGIKLADRFSTSATTGPAAALEASVLGSGLLFATLCAAQDPAPLDALLGAMFGFAFSVGYQVQHALYRTSDVRLKALLLAVLFAELNGVPSAPDIPGEAAKLHVWSFAAWAGLAVPLLFILNRFALEATFLNASQLAEGHAAFLLPPDMAPPATGSGTPAEFSRMPAGWSKALFAATAFITFNLWYAAASTAGGGAAAVLPLQLTLPQACAYLAAVGLSYPGMPQACRAAALCIALLCIAGDPHSLDAWYLVGVMHLVGLYHSLHSGTAAAPSAAAADPQGASRRKGLAGIHPNAPPQRGGGGGVTRSKSFEKFAAGRGGSAGGAAAAPRRPGAPGASGAGGGGGGGGSDHAANPTLQGSARQGIRPGATLGSSVEGEKGKREEEEDEGDDVETTFTEDGVKIVRRRGGGGGGGGAAAGVEPAVVSRYGVCDGLDSTAVLLPCMLLLWKGGGEQDVHRTAVWGSCLLGCVSAVDMASGGAVRKRLAVLNSRVLRVAAGALCAAWLLFPWVLGPLCACLACLASQLSVRDNDAYIRKHDVVSASHQYFTQQLFPPSLLLFYQTLVILLGWLAGSGAGSA